MTQHVYNGSPLAMLRHFLVCALALFACLSARAAPELPSLDLTGTGWDLVKVQSMDDSRFAPAANDSGDYSLRFGEAGRVAIGAGCNRGQASLELLAPPRLKFGPVAVTRALCRPPSIADRYIDQLPWVRSYVLQDGHLYLATAADASILEYKPLEDESVTARVLGLSLLSKEPEALREKVLQILISHYGHSHSLSATTAEIEQFLENQDAQTGIDGEQQTNLARSERLKRAAMRQHEAATAIQTWKANAALFAAYGGRIIKGPQGPVPLDAQRKLMQDARDAGDFSLLYPSVQDALWDYFDASSHDSLAPADSLDARSAFSTPPWAANAEAP